MQEGGAVKRDLSAQTLSWNVAIDRKILLQLATWGVIGELLQNSFLDKTSATSHFSVVTEKNISTEVAHSDTLGLALVRTNSIYHL